jgi:hypothetical protein
MIKGVRKSLLTAATVLKLQTGIRGWFHCKGFRSWSWLRITLKSVESIMPTTPRDTQSNDIQHNILKHATLSIDDNQQNNPLHLVSLCQVSLY